MEKLREALRSRGLKVHLIELVKCLSQPRSQDAHIWCGDTRIDFARVNSRVRITILYDDGRREMFYYDLEKEVIW